MTIRLLNLLSALLALQQAARGFLLEDDDLACEPCDATGETSLLQLQVARGTSYGPCATGNGKDGDCYSAKSRLAPADVLRLYQLTHIVTSLLDRHNVWHIASSGTLLGAVRNKGMIPHDDDIDFNILRDPGASVVGSQSFQRDLERNGLFLQKVHEDFWKCKDAERPNLAVDLFAMISMEGVLTFDHGFWPGTKLPISVMAAGGLVRYNFGASQVWGPTRPVVEQYLSEKYGSHWATQIRCDEAVSFHDCVGIQNTQYDLTEPARPFEPLLSVKY